MRNLKKGIPVLLICLYVFTGLFVNAADSFMVGEGRNGKGSLQEEPQYARGEVIVKLRIGEGEKEDLLSARGYPEIMSMHQSILTRLKSEYGLGAESPVYKGAHNKLKDKDSINFEHANLLAVYTLKTDKDPLTVSERLNKDPEVEYAEPNYILKAQ